MKTLEKSGRRCVTTSAPGLGRNKDNAAGGGEDRLCEVIITPTRAAVNLFVSRCHAVHRYEGRQ